MLQQTDRLIWQKIVESDAAGQLKLGLSKREFHSMLPDPLILMSRWLVELDSKLSCISIPIPTITGPFVSKRNPEHVIEISASLKDELFCQKLGMF